MPSLFKATYISNIIYTDGNLPPAASGAPLREASSCNAPALPGALERPKPSCEPGKYGVRRPVF